MVSCTRNSDGIFTRARAHGAHHHCCTCAAACSSRSSSRNTGSTRNSNTPTRSSSETMLAGSCNSTVAWSTPKMSHRGAGSDRAFQPIASETNQRLEQLPWRRAQKCLVAAACRRIATPVCKRCSSSRNSPSLRTARPGVHAHVRTGAHARAYALSPRLERTDGDCRAHLQEQ